MTTDLLPPAVSDSELDRVVAQINRLFQRASLTMVLGVGELIVDRFYSGDLEAWRCRGVKDASFRKLTARPDLQLSTAGLYRAVATYELCMRLGVSSWRHLGVSHLYAVLGLEHEQQRRLIAQAEDHAWTVRELGARASAMRIKAPGKRGRPRLPAFVKTVGKLGRILDDDGEPFGDLEKLDDLSDEEAQRLHRTVADMRARCERLERKLERKLSEDEAERGRGQAPPADRARR